jgi:hypothetical protein
MVNDRFHEMHIAGNSYTVTKKLNFVRKGVFRRDTVASVVEFAFAMTFGKVGQHRNVRSGGSFKREYRDIFINSFQGKLGEFAVANLIYTHKDFQPPDLSAYELGFWEDADFELGKNSIAVKSTKWFGNLMLLETKDWDKSGKYISSIKEPKSYSHLVLVRIKPDIEKVYSALESQESQVFEIKKLTKNLIDIDWEYDIPGYITHEDLVYVINSNMVIPKNSLLNGRIKMDAENYYVQANDLRKADGLLSDLNG